MTIFACFTSCTFVLKVFVSDCTNSLPAFPICFHPILLSQKMTLMKYSFIKCQSSHMKHIDIVKITIYLVKLFIHSIYPSIVYMYFTLCNGFHALGIYMYKTQMHIRQVFRECQILQSPRHYVYT